MPRGRGHGPRMSNEKAKDFKGTMKKLMAYLSAYKIGIFFVIVFAIGKYMVKWLTGTSDAEIISNALMYMKINIVFFLVLSILLVLRSSLQGVGRKAVPVLGSGIELILKFGAVNIITNRLGYFGVCILEPIIWVICAVLVLGDFIVYQKTNKKIYCLI